MTEFIDMYTRVYENVPISHEQYRRVHALVELQPADRRDELRSALGLDGKAVTLNRKAKYEKQHSAKLLE